MIAPARPLLDIVGLNKSFGGLRVIDDLSFAVHEGDRVALIGPNGAGKTTAFNLITGVYPADSGRIVLDDADITDVPSRKRIRFGLARTFQDIRLMPHLRAVENVMIAQNARNGSALGMLQPVSLLPGNRWRAEAHAALRDADLGEYADQTAGTLPYGVQKRIGLVRALAARPRILLLDEPAAGLNPAESDALRRYLERVSDAGVTLLVIEHDMNFVGAFCHRVIVLNFGCKIAECTPLEARGDPVVREAYLGTDD